MQSALDLRNQLEELKRELDTGELAVLRRGRLGAVWVLSAAAAAVAGVVLTLQLARPSSDAALARPVRFTITRTGMRSSCSVPSSVPVRVRAC